MRVSARAPFHALRSAMVALTVLTLAAGAHTLAGGALPAPGIFLALLALTGLAATTATRLKLNLPAMAALLGTAQLVLHSALSVFSGAPAPGAAAPAPAGSVLAHHVAQLPPPGVGGSHVAGPGIHLDLGAVPLLMLVGHVLATLLCAVLLARGEDALWSLAAWLRPLLRLHATVMPDVVVVPLVGGWEADSAPLPWRNLRRDCRRGPPAAIAFS